MQKELEDNPGKRDNWEIFSTSGSSGIPLKFMLTNREAACMNANWIRVTMFTGYKPFTEKMITFLTTHSKVDPDKGDSFIQKLEFCEGKLYRSTSMWERV